MLTPDTIGELYLSTLAPVRYIRQVRERDEQTAAAGDFGGCPFRGEMFDMKQEREMKEDIRIQGQLRVYLQWPLFMAVILMAANVVIGLVDLKAGIVRDGLYPRLCSVLRLAVSV